MLSVIIPVYNAKDGIRACLDALYAQSMEQIEIVLVDDHGSDDSMLIAREYASEHDRMNFVFVDNGRNMGPGAARNNGVRHASGQYVAFVDSDDWVSPDFCKSLYDAATANQAQMAYCHISFDYPDGSSIIKRNPIVPDGNFDRKAFLRRYKSYFTTFIYDRRFLLDNGIVFPDTRSAEDSCFLLCALLSCQRIAAVDRAMYHYVIGSSSISRKKDRNRWKNRIESFRKVRQFAKANKLYRSNLPLIEWLCFKKGFLLSVRDWLANII